MLRLTRKIVDNIHAPRYEARMLKAWLELRGHYLFDGEYVALAEIVRHGESFALARSPTFRWFWLARLWISAIRLVERQSERVVTRIVTPDRADVLVDQYVEWTNQGMACETFSERLRKWASHKP